MLYERFKEEIQIWVTDLHIKIGAVLVGIMLVSLLFYLLYPGKKANRILFFPKVSYTSADKSPVLKNESRTLPQLATTEENIRLFVQELLLGPVHPELAGFCPAGTKLVSLFLKGSNLYLDLSAELLETAGVKQPLTIQDKLALLKKNILFNFHNVKDIHIFLNGQIPQF
jgi:hypothetical protein